MVSPLRNRIARLPRRARPPLIGFALLCPLIVAAAGWSAQENLAPAGDTIQTTPAPGPASPENGAPETPAEDAALGVEITTLRAGAPPFAWAGEEKRLATFITDSDRRLSVVAWARARGASPEAIRWTVTPPAGFSLPDGALPTGPVLRVTLWRPQGNPKGGGGPLTLTVRASVERDGRTAETAQTITQDERDQMRQEYVDLRRETVPERRQFLDAGEYAKRYGRRFPQFRFEELNWSVNPETGERYRYAILAERLLEGLTRLRERHGGPLIVTSGYRNPTRQVEVHAPVRESLHQYGLAADLAVPSDVAFPKTGRKTPSEADWLAFAEVAAEAGASWVEPLPETEEHAGGYHLHVDFRAGGPRSACVSLKGRVLDAETGEPVVGALVRVAGMPARTDAEGRFALRHVLTPRERRVAVTAQGYQPLTQAVPISAGANTCELRLRSEPRPRLVATLAPAVWKNERDGLAVAELRLRNTGERPARNVAVAAAVPEGAPPAVAVSPPRLEEVPPGEQVKLRLAFKVTPTQNPEQEKVILRLVAYDPDGVARLQHVVATWTPPAPTPRAEAAPRPPRPVHAAVGAAAVGAGVAGAVAVARHRTTKTMPPAAVTKPAAPPASGAGDPEAEQAPAEARPPREPVQPTKETQE